jgi:serine/threonine protein kinase
VWKSSQGNESVALKMLHLYREFNFESFAFHQVDAMALEHQTKSQIVITAYGFCGQSTLVELAPLDARSLTKDESIGSKDRLRMTRDLARALNHNHSIDYGEGANSTLIHNNVNMVNIATVDMKTLKFNDFNLAVLLKWNASKPCGYPTHFCGDLWRSPEEVRNATYVSEKIDVYSQGNVLFQILTRHQPWTWIEPRGPLSIDEVAKRKLEGMVPTFPDRILDSLKVAHQAMYYGTACML